MTGTPQVGVDDNRFQRARGQLCRPAADLGVTEAVVGLGGLEVVLAAAKDEPVSGLGAAKWPHVKLAVLEHLAMTDDDLGPGLTLDGEAQPADEVLPEVHECATRRRRPDLYRPEGVVADDGRPDIRREAAGIKLQRFDAAPARQGCSRAQPRVVDEPGVDRLAVV